MAVFSRHKADPPTGANSSDSAHHDPSGHDNDGANRFLSRLLPKRLSTFWHAWITRRIPASRELTLSHRSIFILPSAFGLAWVGLILLLYLFGTNYQNNLVIGLSLLLASLFQTCIIYSYKNLAGLQLRAMKNAPVYAGDSVSFAVQLNSKSALGPNIKTASSSHQHICLRFAGNHHVRVQHIFQEQLAHVPYEMSKRGLLRPKRITVESYFPLGLCRAWSYVDLTLEQVIFAKPKPADIHLTQAEQDVQEHQLGKQRQGVDEFNELKAFVQGESLKQVAWKQWAQGKGLLTKTFSQPQGEPVWLMLAQTQGRDLEDKLSHLAWQVNELSQKQQVFGLKLERQVVPQNTGEIHRLACQQAIALFEHNLAMSSVTTSNVSKEKE
jgi:uncharacterized protein (DUF58 family)